MNIFNRLSPTAIYKSPRLHDSRLGEAVKSIHHDQIAASQPGFVVLGFPDDDGVDLNYGRRGAAEAPDKIRHFLYRMAAHNENSLKLYDLGNMVLDGELVDRQTRGRLAISHLLSHKHRFVSLGGGNDYAYPDGAGFLDVFLRQKTKKTPKPLIINIDAHFDMRPMGKEPNSGTPFRQLLEEFQGFDMACVGIQPFANTTYFYEYAKKHKAKIFEFNDCHGNLNQVFKKLSKVKKQPTYLSIDIDAFSACYAPGASASHTIGLDAIEFIKAMPILMKGLDIKGIGIYEVAPSLDEGNKTSQLAATILYTFLMNQIPSK